MPRKALNDRTLKSLKPAPAGKIEDWWDAGFPGFGVRISDTGRKTFVLAARYPGSTNPTRRALGTYPAISLADAHDKARAWLRKIEHGIDPHVEDEKRRLEEQRRRSNTFAAVAEDFIAEKLPKERRGEDVEREIRRDLIPEWGGLPVTDITDDQIAALVKRKARTAPAQARNLLATIKRFFQWAIHQHAYGLKLSPAAALKPAALCGEKVTRHRVLSEDELTALWRSSGKLSYPYRQVYRLLILTGLRLNEVADASWSEFDPVVVRTLKQKANGEVVDWSKIDRKHFVWVIPASRMKGRESKARAHAVPLTVDMLAVLGTVPLFDGGNFLFSTTAGKSPVWMSDKVKKDLDLKMLEALRDMAIKRGDDPADVTLEPWTNHDLRRVVRSGLSRLRIAEEVREAVLAHVRPGIKGVYDVHDYLDEKREALEMWNARVRGIVEPAPANVVELSKARA